MLPQSSSEEFRMRDMSSSSLDDFDTWRRETGGETRDKKSAHKQACDLLFITAMTTGACVVCVISDLYTCRG